MQFLNKTMQFFHAKRVVQGLFKAGQGRSCENTNLTASLGPLILDRGQKN